jgi:membrane-bound inhibitor of C-type lysozyme
VGIHPAATWLCAGICLASACGAYGAQPSGEPGIVAAFACDGGKTIHAVFATGQPPSVELTLSDGRKMRLPQVLSASGARYANHDGSFVFWNKGRTAFVEEAGHQTYSGCVQTK